MRNILFFTLPLWGHINPNRDLLKILSRKVNLLCVASSKFQNVFDELNIKMISYPSCVEEYYENGALYEKEEILAKKYFINQYDYQALSQIMNANYSVVEDIYWHLNEVIDDFQPNLIISDAAAFWAAPIANKFHKKYVNIESATNMSDISQDKYFIDYIEQVISKEIGEELNATEILHNFQVLERKQTKSFSTFANCKKGEYCKAEKTIAYMIEELQLGSKEIVEEFLYVGFDTKIERLEKDNLIYVTRGTITDEFNLNILKNILESIDVKEPYHTIATLGNADVDFERFSSTSKIKNINIYKTVEQIEVLKKSKVMISHGGITGVREAITCETPIIIYPVTFHCYQVGLAVEKEKIGIMLRQHPLDKREVKEALNKILRNEDYYNNIKALKTKVQELYEKQDLYTFFEELIGE